MIVEAIDSEHTCSVAGAKLETFRTEFAYVFVIGVVLWRGGRPVPIELIEYDVLDFHAIVRGRCIETVAIVGEARLDIVDRLGLETGLQDGPGSIVLQGEGIADFLSAESFSVTHVCRKSWHDLVIGADVEGNTVAVRAAAVGDKIEIVVIVASSEADQQLVKHLPPVLHVDPEQFAFFGEAANGGVPGPRLPHCRIVKVGAGHVIVAVLDTGSNVVRSCEQVQPQVAAPVLDLGAIETPAVEAIEFKLRLRPIAGQFDADGAATVVAVVAYRRAALCLGRKQRIAFQNRPVRTRSEFSFLVSLFVADREAVPHTYFAADLDEADVLLGTAAGNEVAIAIFVGIAVLVHVRGNDPDLACEPPVCSAGQFVAIV